MQEGLPNEIVGQDLKGGHSSSSSNSLHSAWVSRKIDALQSLLERGAHVDERSGGLNSTPLHLASYGGEFEIAKTLIKYGADVNSRNDVGRTPLHYAAQTGLVDLLQLLLENGADIHATERKGYTALHIASGHGHLKSVRLLLERGANVQIRNGYGRTASQHALLYGHRHIAQLLSECDVGGVTVL